MTTKRSWLLPALTAVFGVILTAAPAQALDGQIAVLHNRRPVAVRVALPEFLDNQLLSSPLVTMLNLPNDMLPDSTGCLCFDLNDDRFAFVHTFFHTHQIIANYNVFLAELGKPALNGVQFTLGKDDSMPTTGSASLRDVPRIGMTSPTPAVEVFTIAHEVAHLVDYRIGNRPTPAFANLKSESEEAGVTEGTANILAALHLGMSGIPAFTADSLDSPQPNVDTFIRFPDLLITRRDVMQGMIDAPLFSARYPTFINIIRDNLANPDLDLYLNEPDEYSSSAVINQPLWQAATQFGFATMKKLYLRTLANWHEEQVNYNTLAKQLVDEAKVISEDFSRSLELQFRQRGLSL